MKKSRIIWFTAGIILILIFLSFTAGAEEIGPDFLLTGQCSIPVRITVLSPEYKHIAQFGEERKESLNRLISHFSLSVNTDSDISETTLMIDREPMFSMYEKVSGSEIRSLYSVEPDTVYVLPEVSAEEDGEALTVFLEKHFFLINRMLDELYPMFDKSSVAFQDIAKQSAASLTFKGYGKGVKRILISFPEQYVAEHFPGALAGLAAGEEGRTFIESLCFSGSQKMTLLYDQDDVLLRINYDGTVGISEDSMRKVSLAWRTVRSDTVRKDNLTMKTPSVKGNDRYNVIYEREVNTSDPVRHNLSWDLQIDLKDERGKKKISCTADLKSAEQNLNGQIQFTVKQEKEEKKITITPSLLRENASEYTGTIEITDNSGKIVTSSMKASVSISPGTGLSFPEDRDIHTVDISGTDGFSSWDPVQDKLNRILVRKLISLPEEEIDFLIKDIPEEILKSVMPSLL